MNKSSKREKLVSAVLSVSEVIYCLWFGCWQFIGRILSKDWWLSHSESPFSVETALPNELYEMYFLRCLEMDLQIKAALKLASEQEDEATVPPVFASQEWWDYAQANDPVFVMRISELKDSLQAGIVSAVSRQLTVLERFVYDSELNTDINRFVKECAAGDPYVLRNLSRRIRYQVGHGMSILHADEK